MFQILCLLDELLLEGTFTSSYLYFLSFNFQCFEGKYLLLNSFFSFFLSSKSTRGGARRGLLSQLRRGRKNFGRRRSRISAEERVAWYMYFFAQKGLCVIKNFLGWWECALNIIIYHIAGKNCAKRGFCEKKFLHVKPMKFQKTYLSPKEADKNFRKLV